MLQIMSYYHKLKQTYNDITTLNTVKQELSQGISIEEIAEKVKVDKFTLGYYIELAFIEEKNLSPDRYVNKEKFNRIFFSLFELPTIQSIKLIKDKNPTASYIDIHIARGVFLRTVKYPITPSQNKLVITPNKNTLPQSIDKILSTIKTPNIKEFVSKSLTDYTPQYFFQNCFNVLSHTLSVYKYSQLFVSFENPEIKQKNITAMYVYGNELTDEEEDLIKVAVLLHDIFKYGLKEKIPSNQKKPDPLHPYYHRGVLKNIKNLLTNGQWITLLALIENHKGKYTVQVPSLTLKTVEKSLNVNILRIYRLLKILQFSNLLANKC